MREFRSLKVAGAGLTVWTLPQFAWALHDLPRGSPALLSTTVTMRRKSLLVGINYTGSDNELQGCLQDVENVAQFLMSRGYPSDESSMVVLTDARDGAYYPTGHNILAAMDWLVSEPECACVLHCT